MALPRQVEEQRRAAEAAIEAHAQGGNPEPAPPAAPPAAPEALAGIPTGEAPAAPAPSGEPRPAATAEEGSVEYWRHRFDVLNGKYQAEVPRLNQQIRDLRDQVQQLTAQAQPVNDAELRQLREDNERLNQQLQRAQQEKPAPAPQLEGLRREYGAELIDGLLAHMESLMQGRLDPLQQRIQHVDQRTQQVSATSNLDRLKAALRESSIDFDQLNNDDGFAAWLDEIDPYSGSPRRALFNKAWSAGEITRTALFFTTYAGSRRQSDDRQTSPKGLDLSAHVTVGSGAAADGNREAQPLVTYDSAQIRQFYEDKRRGRYTPEEAARIENEIFAANAQPR